MSTCNPEERRFYEIEAQQNRWSLSELKRQFNTGASVTGFVLSRDRSSVFGRPPRLAAIVLMLVPGSGLILSFRNFSR